MIKSNQNKYDFLTNFITEEKYLQNPPLESLCQTFVGTFSIPQNISGFR